MLRNWIRSLGRREGRQRQREIRSARHEAVAPTDKVVQWESTRKQVVDAVLTLDEPYRTVVIQRYYEDLPPRELARRMDLPVETVHTRLKRGRARLREKLAELFDADGRDWAVALAPLAGIAGSGTGGAALAGSVSGGVAAGLVIKAAAALLLVAGAWFSAWWVVRAGNDGVIDESNIPSVSGPGAPGDPGHPGGEAAAGLVASTAGEPKADPGPHVPSIQPIESTQVCIDVTGVVLDADGSPLEGVEIAFLRLDTYRPWSILSRYPSGATNGAKGERRWIDTGVRSDASGRYAFTVPKRRGLLNAVRLSLPDRVPEIRFLLGAMPGADGAYRLETTRLEKPYRITGIVVDESGEPVAGCRVSGSGVPWERWSPVDPRDAVTDEEGRFRLSMKSGRGRHGPGLETGFRHRGPS